MILIKNGCVYTMTGEIYEKGYIITDGEKIKEVGNMKFLKAADSEFEKVYDVSGKFVMPGIVDGHSHIGMWEDSLGFEGSDGNEDTDPITPQLRAIDAINPLDKSFEEGLRAGVTTSVTGPGSANVLGGSFAAVKMYGICVDDMVIKENVAVKGALGENPKTVYNEKNQAPVTRMGAAAMMREALIKATEYKRMLEEYEEDSEENDKPDFDMKSEALLSVLKKEVPMKIHAHRLDDIFTAIRIAKEFNINITLEHATEAHLAAERIAKEGYPVLIGPNMLDRSKPELRNMEPEAAGILELAGLKPAIISDHPEIPCKYLTMSAALAVKGGMSRLEALRAITIYPAMYCGIGDRVGSLEAGKDADIAVFSGHPFDYMTRAELVFVNGRCVVGE